LSTTYHRWTKAQEKFIRDNYRWIGDYGLAELMNEKFPHKYSWTKKNVEKKRQYLNLHRSKDEARLLKWFANKIIKSENGCYSKAWDTRGRSKEGEVRKWGKYDYIKTEGKFIPVRIHIWKVVHGSIPKGMSVIRKDLDKPQGDINNLLLVPRSELAKRNKLSQWPNELRETLSKLNKVINEKQAI
jgi:hypothetical protein